VSAGDHLWSIAQSIVGSADHDPTEREIRRYWRELIRVNRDRLVDPSNPDYILPGQQFRLPPTSN
jgi:nucleoid-associated protein YgaU